MPYRLPMLADTIPASIVLISAGTVAWMRRKTWASPYDRSITVAITLLAAAFAISLPVLHYTLGEWLNHITGVAHLRHLVAHILIIVSAGALIHAAICRILPDQEIKQFMQRWVDLPSLVGGLGMLISFVISGELNESDEWADILDVPAEAPLVTYWVILSITLGTLLLTLIKMMSVLRKDPRSCPMASAFIVGAWFGLGLCISWLINAWSVIPNEIPWALVTGMGISWVVGGFMSIHARYKHVT